jgi:hypothetical protein
VNQRNSEVGVRKGWRSVPICDYCWVQEEPDREPVRLKEPTSEACYRCGQITLSGIYVRRDV